MEPTYDTKHGVSLTTILDGFVDYSVFGSDLISACLRDVGHSNIVVAEVNLREALVEKDLCRIKFELESKLFVIAGNKRGSVSENTRTRYQNCGSKGTERGGRSSGCSHCLVPPQVQ